MVMCDDGICCQKQMMTNSVTVLICGDEKNYSGMTIAWASQVEKRHILVSLPSNSALTQRIVSGERFTVSVLNANQSDIARQYGGQIQRNPLQPDQAQLETSHWSVPTVKNSVAQLLCVHKHHLLIESQMVVIAKVKDTRSHEGVAPLIYDKRAYFG